MKRAARRTISSVGRRSGRLPGYWRAAYRACRDALDGWRTAREAPTAFVKAARTAGLLVTGRKST
ncbi:DUF982 domain-containing protein [Mesorhizobium sp.]|uniref:DUF982 domain-containing protein n=1 Tax=Mesorhizobium sp. TaxID=1871066 RepID=UPI00257CFAF3|nr:DUF982 domain-containing protein [Mesorhizobium sp.]